MINQRYLFSGVTTDQLQYVWPAVQPLVKKFLDTDPGLFEPQDILAALFNKDMQLWVTLDKENNNKIIGAIVTEIVDYPRMRVLRIFGLGGKDFSDWIHLADKELSAFQQHVGAKRMEAFVRPGLAKILQKHGFTKRCEQVAR